MLKGKKMWAKLWFTLFIQKKFKANNSLITPHDLQEISELLSNQFIYDNRKRNENENLNLRSWLVLVIILN